MGWITRTFKTEEEADAFVVGLRYVNESSIGEPISTDMEDHWEVRFEDKDVDDDQSFDPEDQDMPTKRLRLRVLTWFTFDHVGTISPRAGAAGEGLFATNQLLRGDIDISRLLDLFDPLLYFADRKDMSAVAALDDSCIGHVAFGDAYYSVFLDAVEDVKP